jgi:hypothetical protein
MQCLPAVSETLLTEGIEYYKSEQFAKARQYFAYILKKEPACWQAQYELANTLMKMNELPAAKEQYLGCLKISPDPQIARSCGQMIAYIDHISGEKPYEGATSATITPVKPDTATSGGSAVEFEHRINIVAPQFGHPAVSEDTVNTVRSVLRNLPPNIYEVLNNGGATVNISPNITDRWPDMLKGKLDDAGLHLAQDAARCYGKDVYIYERKLIPGTTQLGGIAFDAESVTNVLCHELGHATDVCSGTFTNTPEVLAIYNADLAVMPADMQQRLWYYTKPGYTGCKEAFAETFAGLLGAHGLDTDEVRNNFPRLRAWAKDKLKM